MSSLSPPLSSPNSAPSQANLADALDENAHLWKRVHALQERAHSMCAENVDLRRQVNILRSRAKAIAPSLSVDTSASVSGLPPSPVPSPMNLLPTPVSATTYTSGLHELKKDVARLQDDNSRLLSSAAEGRTIIRQLRRELERERELCSCRHSLRPRDGGHRRSSSNSLPSTSPSDWGKRPSPVRRKWDSESQRRSEWDCPPDLVGGHVRTSSVRSLVE